MNLRVPGGACDCHLHVYDARFPADPDVPSTPPDAPASLYRELQRQLGLARAIVVQPTAYGFDNACTIDAVAALGPRARGVAVVRPESSAQELERLHRAGIRGVRYQMLGKPILSWDTVLPMAARIAGRGWHVQLQLDGRELPQHEAMLHALPSRLVIDHTGKFLEPVAVDHPAFRALLRLVEGGNCWVKLSAPYETSKVGAPQYQDVAVLARALIAANPGRCLWGSNWPFPNASTAPSAAALLELLLAWAGDDRTATRILVTNPAELYGF